MRTINVAMVNTELTRGGAARMAATLVNSLNQHAENVAAVLYHCETRENLGTTIGLKKPLSRQINAGLARIGGSYAVVDLGVARNIIASTQDADILHVHNLHGYYLNFERLLLARQNRPVVWTWHDMWGATGRCGYSYECEGWLHGCPSCPSKNSYPAAWIDRAASEFRRKTRLFGRMGNLWVVSPSRWLADIAIKRGFDASKVLVIPNAVDTNKYQLISKVEARRRLGLADKGFVVLFVASDCGDARKGYIDFANMCEGRPWCAIAVGKRPAQPRNYLDHVGVIKNQATMALYYAAADVMVLPTYADNYPNSVIEALLCGTPVVGYDEGGVASQLDMQSCAVVPKGEWRSLVDNLDELNHQGGKTVELEETLSGLARERWAPEIVAQQYENVYKLALDTNI